MRNVSAIVMKSACRKQRGVALITALLIVSLATIMAVELVSRQYMDIRRTGNIMSSDKAYLQALTMETSAAQLLAFSRNTLQSKFDDKEQFDQAVLGINANAMQAESGEATVQLLLVYAETLFNVNTLVKQDDAVNDTQRNQFRRLLSSVLNDIGEPAAFADDLVSSVIDWIDENEDVLPGGAEDSVYESKEIPYKTANRMMASASELLLVEGFTTKILYGIPKDPADENSVAILGILNYVTALPDRSSSINVNLVSDIKMIQSLSPFITEIMAEEVIASQPFENLGDFREHQAWESAEGFSEGNGDWKKLTNDLQGAGLNIQSRFFVAKSTATLGNSVLALNSLVFIDAAGTKIDVISRAIGTNGI